MPVHVYLFAAVAISSVPLFVWALRGATVELPTRRRRLVRANLAVASTPVPSQRQVVLAQSTTARIVQPTMEWMTKVARRLTPAQMIKGLEQRRNLAGANSTWDIEKLLAAKVLLAGIGGMLGLAVFASNPTMATLFAGAAFTGGGFFAPDIVLGAKGRERQKQIERSFPGVLDQLTICVEAGLGLDAAIARAAHSGKGPLAAELARVLQDVQLGVSRQAALEAMVKRTDVSDIRHFVVALGQANRYGVPIVQALRVQAMEAREQRRTRAEERAQKLSVKLLFPLVFCILPALFVVLLGPAAIRIAHLGITGSH
jgi:tight adherence protein C